MDYLEALRLLHQELAPLNYCEIGVRSGVSLALAKAPTIGVDPDFDLRAAPAAPLFLFRMTSDDFFAQNDAAAILGGPIDFGFIDGMHQVEFALRDFMNLERHASRSAVIAIDDVLPQQMAYATRTRTTQIWTGDVYRLLLILRHYRPDLAIVVYDVDMKGLGVISRLDPGSNVLRESYARIGGEIASGLWSCASVEEIRRVLEPRPIAQLGQDVTTLAAWRRSFQCAAARDGTELYLDLLKRSISNQVYLDNELRILYLRNCMAGRDHFDQRVLHDIRNTRRSDYEKLFAAREIGRFMDRDIRNCGYSHSMIGDARLQNLHECLDIIRHERIPGALMECGVWRGGACIFMAAYLRAYGMTDRRIVAADSFDGLPPSSHEKDAKLNLSKERYPELAVPRSEVRENFRSYGLDPDSVIFLEGWFKDTLRNAPVEEIALLRMDGDLYESTTDILEALYEKVVPGGVVIVDDYHVLTVCRQAVEEFFARQEKPVPPLTRIDQDSVWFRKLG